MCSSFIRAVLICSFRTSIWPSSCCFNNVVSFNWLLAFSIAASISSVFSSIASYSVFVFSYRVVASASSLVVFSKLWSTAAISFLSRSVSSKNKLISYVFKDSFFFRYSLATSDCFSKGPICFSSSARISFTRTRFCLSSSNFFTDIFFRFLNFTIPAASSNSSLRSSGFPLKILSICPCPIIEYPSFPIPVS